MARFSLESSFCRRRSPLFTRRKPGSPGPAPKDRPAIYRYVEPPMSYQRPTEEDLQAIEKDNERNDLPASHDDIAGAVPIQPDGKHSD